MTRKYAEPDTELSRMIAGVSFLVGLAYLAVSLYDMGYRAGYGDCMNITRDALGETEKTDGE